MSESVNILSESKEKRGKRGKEEFIFVQTYFKFYVSTHIYSVTLSLPSFSRKKKVFWREKKVKVRYTRYLRKQRKRGRRWRE